MPTYDFSCAKCAYKFEQFLSIADRNRPLDEPCPQCKAEGVIAKSWIVPPVTGCDATLGPGQDFKEVMRKVARGTPKCYHERLERAAGLRARKYGSQ